jgi:hypothetical protein
MKKALEWLLTHAPIVMGIGFGVAVLGLIVYAYAQTHLHPGMVRSISFDATVVGFAIYVIGRICLQVQRNRARLRAAQEKNA